MENHFFPRSPIPMEVIRYPTKESRNASVMGSKGRSLCTWESKFVYVSQSVFPWKSADKDLIPAGPYHPSKARRLCRHNHVPVQQRKRRRKKGIKEEAIRAEKNKDKNNRLF
jgi:hypothetical protein